MINSILIFLFGAVSGCGVSYFLTKAYWKKRLAAVSRSHADQIALYDGYLDSAKQQTQASVQRWIKQREQLEAKSRDSLDEGIRRQTQLRQQYEEKIAKVEKVRAALQLQFYQYRAETDARLEQQSTQAQSDRAELQAALEQCEKETEIKVSAETEKGIQLAIEQSKRLKEEKRSLQIDLQATRGKLDSLRDDLNKIVIKNAELQQELTQRQQQADSEIQQAYQDSGVTLAAVAEMTFTNLVFLQNSTIEIDKHQKHAAGILHVLKDIDNREFGSSKKIRATNKEWFESKAKLGVVRIYFHKDKPTFGQCEVLIADKRNQNRDFSYLKDRHK